MQRFLRRLIKFTAYLAATIVILLAIAVGLFRLFLPRLPQYQDEIKAWASAAIGMQVEFSGMDARWGLSGPQLEFHDAELVRTATNTRVVAAEQVSIGVELLRLLLDRTLVVDRIEIRDTAVELRQLPNGNWWIQGMPVEELLDVPAAAGNRLGDFDVVGEDIEVGVIRPGDERPRFVDVQRLSVRNDETRIAIDAAARLPDTLGRTLRVAATRQHARAEVAGGWDVSVDASQLDLAGIAALDEQGRWPVTGGNGGLSVSMRVVGEVIRTAIVEFAFEDVSIADGVEFAIASRFEYETGDDGWLVSADELRFGTASGSWPVTTLRVESGTDPDGRIVMIDARGDYVDLGDLHLFAPLLDAERRAVFEGFDADGVVRELAATISDIGTEQPNYSVAASFERAGFAADGKRPGVRGFTGRLRAERSGGSLEIRSDGVVLDLEQYLPEPVAIDEAHGTVIWRRSGERVTVLSDNIAIRNANLDSHSSLQVTIDADHSPVVDLVSNWSIADINEAKRYIPSGIMSGKLYDWFQQALVAGSIPQGTTRLVGPLGAFPFDGGEGRLLLEANVRDTTFHFLRNWPAAEIIELDVVLDNTRLYSETNRSMNRGREIVDAKIEIADLRDPVLTIESWSTGTLESIHDYISHSPIGNVFGGHLDKIRVAGDASFDLDLTVPIADWRAFEFSAHLVANDGTLEVQGLRPPVTGLSGAVTIGRDTVTSEALGGEFLGRPVSIELGNAPDEEPRFQVRARAHGSVAADALVTGLGLPLEGLIDGETTYTADLMFPRAGQDPPVPFTVRIASDLVGLAVQVPEPFDKPADEAAEVAGEIAFDAGGARIDSSGGADGGVSWQVSLERGAEGWDLDRGVLGLGGAAIGAAETRGLHIRGAIEEMRLDDWLTLSRTDERRSGTADRIRSIDVEVGSLRLLGQRLVDHRVRVDRSARDWLVQFEGDSVSGSVFVPYDFGSNRAMVMDMERLVLPGDEEAVVDAERQVDPRNLPPISLKAQEFAIGQRYFGAIQTELKRTPDGLVTDSIVATDETFEIVGNGRWVADAGDPAGHHSYLMASLTSTDIPATMRRLDYQPGIVGDDMTMLFELDWSGGPRTEFLDSLDGSVRVRFGPGQLDEIEPGAGRLFGLMSIVALPRRLSLDFSDVFDKGFGFDLIEGSFRIVDGEAYTCDLSLEGPAADIAIIGRTSLTAREYEQSAVVSANFGSALPVVGAVVAGPQAAAALLIFSQIFKKPLQEMSQVYYDIEGPWDDPQIESANAAAFAAAGELAGCIAEVPGGRR